MTAPARAGDGLYPIKPGSEGKPLLRDMRQLVALGRAVDRRSADQIAQVRPDRVS